MKPMSVLWVDCETTGLEPKAGALLEVALAVTDTDLTLLDSFNVVVALPLGFDMDRFDHVALAMHKESGLLSACRSGAAVPLQQAQDLAIGFVQRWFHGSRPELGGSSVHFDRAWLTMYWAALADQYHRYRNVDVSTVRKLCEVWQPELVPLAAEQDHAHRAEPDILATLSELRVYHRALFPAAGNPDALTGLQARLRGNS